MVYGFPRSERRSTITFLRLLCPHSVATHLIEHRVPASVSGTRRRRFVGMDRLHEMLVEDEILFCGLTLLSGIVAGAVSRLVAGLLGRRAA
jgi:hypothetical protein